MKLTVKNWAKFQHYADRNPPWIKLHVQLLNDRGFMGLSLARRGLLCQVWVLASESKDGTWEGEMSDLSWRLRCDVSAADVMALQDARLLKVEGLLADASVCYPEGETEAEERQRQNVQRTSAPPSAVAAPSLSICKPSTSKAVAPVVRTRANPADPWPTSEAVDMYRRRFGAGSGHPKAIIGAIDPLVRGQAQARASPASAAWRDAVRPAFKRYLGLGPGPGTTHPKPNAADFVDMFADWLPGAKGSNGKASVVDLYQGGLELLEERRGRDGDGSGADTDGDARSRIEAGRPERERDQGAGVGGHAARRVGA